jgi:hypothetical protein
MSKLRWFNAAPIVLACWGLLVLTAEIRAEEAAPNTITDVALGDGGVARGVIVDGQGKPVDGATVSIKVNSRVVATVVSDAKGEFVIREMRGGIHEVHAPQGTSLCRFWTARSAPPAAKNRITVVSDAQTVRGQSADVHADSTPPVTGGGYWGNGAGSAVGNSIGNGFGHGGGAFGGCGNCGEGCCSPPAYYNADYLYTAAVIAGAVAIGYAICDDDDHYYPSSP